MLVLAQVLVSVVVTYASSVQLGKFAFLGPFQRGKTELDGGPAGGVSLDQMEIGGENRFFSELSPHHDGKVGWSVLKEAVDGTVIVQPQAGV